MACDSFYGRDQGLLQHIADTDCIFVADTPVDTLVWAQQPEQTRRPEKMKTSGAQRADKLPHPARKSVHTRTGENGPVRVSASAQRVWIWPTEAQVPMECWLIVTEQTDGTMKFTLCNAPQSTGLATLVRWQGQRFFIEQTFKNGKSHAGMADYQVRKYRGWQHHMALVGLALLFLLEERDGHLQSVPLLSATDISEILHWHFCTQPTQAAVIEQIARRHARRAKATESKQRVDRRNQRLKT